MRARNFLICGEEDQVMNPYALSKNHPEELRENLKGDQ